MLQQTQAARVVPAFERFVATFPSVRALAAAPTADVLRAWDGLGYNRRAVALSRAARQIAARHGGRVPRDTAALSALPGVGPYTADAVAAIAFGAPVVAADVNVLRVSARAVLGAEPGTVRRSEAAAAAVAWLDAGDPAGWNQAVMDLGREVCRAAPRCGICPISASCAFVRGGRRRDPGAAPARRSRAQPPFEGSMRQVRGAVVRALRTRSPMSIDALARGSHQPRERVLEAVEALAREGLVTVEGRTVGLPN